jgi:hypothetical protein
VILFPVRGIRIIGSVEGVRSQSQQAPAAVLRAFTFDCVPKFPTLLRKV